MTGKPVSITITYDPVQLTGKLVLQAPPENSVWDRMQQSAINSGSDYAL